MPVTPSPPPQSFYWKTAVKGGNARRRLDLPVRELASFKPWGGGDGGGWRGSALPQRPRLTVVHWLFAFELHFPGGPGVRLAAAGEVPARHG